MRRRWLVAVGLLVVMGCRPAHVGAGSTPSPSLAAVVPATSTSRGVTQSSSPSPSPSLSPAKSPAPGSRAPTVVGNPRWSPPPIPHGTIALDAALLPERKGLVLLQTCHLRACVYRVDSTADGGRTWHVGVVVTGDQSGNRSGWPGVVWQLSAIDDQHYLVVGLQTWLTADGGAHWRRINTGWATVLAQKHSWLVVGLPRLPPGDTCAMGVDLLTEAGRLLPQATLPSTCAPESIARSGAALWMSAVGRKGGQSAWASTDDGQHWHQRPLVSDDCYGPQATFQPGSSILLVACPGDVNHATPGLLMRSDDQGRHWRRVGTAPFTESPAPHFAAADVLWRVDPSHGVYRSFDQGAHWTLMPFGRPASPRMPRLQAFSAIGHSAWIIAPEAGNAVLHVTQDAGATWVTRPLPAAPVSTVLSAALVGSRHLDLLVRSCRDQVWSYTVEMSRDDGARWRQSVPFATSRAQGPGCAPPVSDAAQQIVAVDQQHLFAYGEAVWVSADSGFTWHRSQPTGPVGYGQVRDGSLWVVCFDCPAGGRAHGQTVERILPDGSATALLGFRQGGPTVPVNVVVSGDSVFVAVAGGTGWETKVRVSNDAGHTWSADRVLPCPAGYPETELAAAGSHSLWLTCAGGAGVGSEPKLLLTSADAGVTWRLVSHLEWAGYAKTLVGDDHFLWRYGSSAALEVSADGGRHWRAGPFGGGGGPEVQAFAAYGPRAWAFGTRLTGGGSFSSKTRDGGRHWLAVSLP